MKIKTVHLVYFSATYTTRTVARCMAQAIGCETVEHDVTCSVPQEETALTSDGELLIAAAPVYAGRIPGRMAEALRMFSGNGTPAIVVCVYGHRAEALRLDTILKLCARVVLGAVAGDAHH